MPGPAPSSASSPAASLGPVTGGTCTKVLYIGLDGCDAPIILRLAEEGRLPSIGALLRDGAVVPTVAPYGTFVGSSWMTITTGRDVAHHGFWNWMEVDPATYDQAFTTPRTARGVPFWQQVSDAGRRVAVLDVPHMDVPRVFNGLALKEWGCHDRHDGTAAYPPTLLDELDALVGRHPVGCRAHPRGEIAFAPCDYTERAGVLRRDDEEANLAAMVRRGVEAKRLASLHVLDQGPWDLFVTVFGEGHCAGHQFWHLHDPAHPRHSAAQRARVGDPLVDVYVGIDAAIGDLVARSGPGATVFVQMNHGMGPHFDGDHLLDELLLRIDRGLAGTFRPGRRSRLAGSMWRHTPDSVAPVRDRMAAAAVRAGLRRGLPATAVPAGPRPDRRWFQLAGNTSVGAVRCNVVGREAAGLVQPGEEYEQLRAALAAALLDVVDVATGTRLVRRVVMAEDVYERSPGDRLPDLFVEWNRDHLVEYAWSPLAGTVVAPYAQWRTGDHHDGGMLIARGAGIAPGRRATPMALTDVAPTLAAAVGVTLADVDGRVHADLAAGATPAEPPVPPSLTLAAEPRPRRTRRLPSPPRAVPTAEVDVEVEVEVDSAATGADTPMVAQLRRQVDELVYRIGLAEREQRVWNTMAWLATEPLRDDVFVSVITPTFNRPRQLAEAIRSVLAQRHGHWEMVVVDDGSHTAAAVIAGFDDPRLRVFEADHGGACAARNLALGHARGDVITYLDDDNTLDPGWLHAVAWAFADRPDHDVLYGARLIDDSVRVYGQGQGGWPMMQFVPFDRVELLRHNFADMGVIAHRSCVPVRFDESLVECGDWDFFLALTECHQPLELPAVAGYYRTGGTDRLTGQQPGDFYRVQAKWTHRGDVRQ